MPPTPFLFVGFSEPLLISFLLSLKQSNSSSFLTSSNQLSMPRIEDDPTQATCPSFEDPEWEFLRQNMVDAHQGDPALMMDEAAQRMKEAWAHKNQ